MRAGRTDGETWLRLSEAASLLGISLNTLRRWSDSGQLACYRSPGGHRRYRRDDVELLLRPQAGDDGPATVCSPAPDAASRKSVEARDTPVVLATLARIAAEGVGVPQCLIATTRGDGRLVLSAVHDASGGTLAADLGRVLTRDEAPCADEVSHTQRRLLIADLRSTKVLTPAEAAVCRARGEAAVLAVPIAADGRLYGVMQLVERRAPRAFAGATVAFAEFLARQAAGIMAASRGESRPGAGAGRGAAAEDTWLTDRDAGAGAAPPDEARTALRILSEALRQRLGAVACDVLTSPDEGRTLTVAAAVGGAGATGLEGLSIARADLGALGAPLSGDGPVSLSLAGLRTEAPHHARLAAGGARHVLAVPVIAGDRALGALEVFAPSARHRYTAEETAVVETMAEAVALVLESADEYRRLNARLADVEDLLEHAAARTPAREVQDCAHAFVRLVSMIAPDCSCTVYATRGDTATVLAGGAALCGGGSDGVRSGRAGGRRSARDAGARLTLPLQAGDATVGRVEIAGPPDADPETLETVLRPAAEILAATLAAHAAAAAQAQRTRDLEVVVKAGFEDAARLSTDEILHTVVRRLADVTRCPVADVYAVENGTLRALLSYDGGRFDPEWEGVVIPLSRYPCSLRAVETREIAVATSLDDEILGADGRYSLERWGYQSQLSMPLVAADRVIGLVELSDYVPRDFREHLDLIRGLGRVAAQALANARLFEQVERRNRILRELVDLGTFASVCPDFDTVLRRVAERLVKTVDAANCDIYQMSDEGLRCVVSYDRSGFDDEAVGKVLDVATYPTVAQAIASGRLLVISGPDDPQLSEREREVYREYGFASEVCVPLIVNDELFGLIDLYDTRPRDFSEYLTFLRSLGMGLAGGFASTLLFRQLERRTTVLREIVEIGALASRTADVHDLMEKAAARLRTTMAASDCDIYALEGGMLRCLASVDETGPEDRTTWQLIEMARYPVAEIAVRTRNPVVVSDFTDPRITDRERRRFATWGYQSLLCVPLVSGDAVLGVLDVFDTRPRDFGDFLDFARSVAQVLAGALRNAGLVDELSTRNRELAELVELGRHAAGASGLTPLLETVTARVCAVVEAAGCQVFAPDGDSYRCLFAWEDGAPSPADIGHLIDLERFPTTRRVLERHETLFVASPDDPSLTEPERRHYAETDWRSDILVPLVVEDRLVGLLEVYDRRPRDYAEHEQFLRRAGQLVAGALEKAQLLERLERANAHLRSLVDAGLEFGATLDHDAVLRSVAERLCVAADATCCDIYRLEGDTMRCLVSIDGGRVDEAFAGTTYRVEDFVGVRESVTAGQPVTVNDILADERVSDVEREENLRWGHRAKAELPLIARGEVVGLAVVFDDKPRDFGGLDLLQSLAQVAASALANAALYDELDRSARRLALIGDVSAELSSSLDLDVVLEDTARRLCAVADVPSCDVYTLDADRRLRCVTSVLEDETCVQWHGRAFPLDDWPAVRSAVDSRTAIVVSSPDDPLLGEEERRLMREYGETAAIISPLIAQDEVIGVLELFETRGPRTFDAEEVAIVASVCRVAALAIRNARLVSDLHVRNRETQLLNEIARATTATLDLTEVMAGAVETLGDLIPVECAMLAVRRGDAFDAVYTHSAPSDGDPAFDATQIMPVVERLERERVLVLDPRRDLAGHLSRLGCETLGAAALIAVSGGDGLTAILGLGAVKPDAFAEVDRRLLERVGTHLAPAVSNARLYDDVKRMHLGNLKALSTALNTKDYYTLGHAARVAAYMVLLGEELGWDAGLLRDVEEAAYLHDIGKIGVSDRVLLKPGGLNSREWELMRQHPVYSADIIRPLFSEELVLGVRHHHERWDGAGYPDGLAGEAIPHLARAMCVVDSYDAMSLRRPYRHELDYASCRAELARCAGSQFDPETVAAFERVLDRLAERKAAATAVAAEAAARLDRAAHATLQSPADEDTEAYRTVAAALRAVRDEHPPTRFLTTFVRRGSSAILVADAEEDESLRSHIGDGSFADEEILRVLAGEPAERTVLFVDRFGVWVSGTAPVLDETGAIVAAVSADLPVTSGPTDVEGLGSSVTQTFTDMVADAAARLCRAEVEAITDGLTGLYNHRYLHERLEEEIERCVRHGGSLALLLIDLDDFKSFNERYGHRAGDRALCTVARVVEGSLRQVDLAARFGGEEFAVLLMDADAAGALEVAERIRDRILATEVTGGHESLAVSVGVALCPSDAGHKEELLDKADWALYLAKRRGGDRVVSFGAEHGILAPEQAATTPADHVGGLGAVAAARDAYLKRRRTAVTHLALALARELDVEAEAMHDVAVAAAAVCEQGNGRGAEAPVACLADRLAVVAATYEALVTGRPYRPMISEAEALERLRRCPALAGDPRLAAAVESVLARRRV